MDSYPELSNQNNLLMGIQSVPWIDGEKIPEESIDKIFRNPPDLPKELLRNSLVIGSRGVGKTTWFRYLKYKHEQNKGIAIHLSLGTVLGPLTKETGQGVLAYNVPKELENSIIGKST